MRNVAYDPSISTYNAPFGRGYMGGRELLRQSIGFGIEQTKSVGGLLLRRLGVEPLEDAAVQWEEHILHEVHAAKDNAVLVDDIELYEELSIVEACIERYAPSDGSDFEKTAVEVNEYTDEAVVEDICTVQPPLTWLHPRR